MSNKGGGPALGEAELELVSEGGVERVKRLRRATQDAAQQRLLRCIPQEGERSRRTVIVRTVWCIYLVGMQTARNAVFVVDTAATGEARGTLVSPGVLDRTAARGQEVRPPAQVA